MKKGLFLIVLLTIVLAILLSIGLFYVPYNDKSIIGSSYSQIQEKYGEFDCRIGDHKVGYKIRERWFDKIIRVYLGGEPKEYYFIEFDDDGVAEKVYIGTDPSP